MGRSGLRVRTERDTLGQSRRSISSRASADPENGRLRLKTESETMSLRAFLKMTAVWGVLSCAAATAFAQLNVSGRESSAVVASRAGIDADPAAQAQAGDPAPADALPLLSDTFDYSYAPLFQEAGSIPLDSGLLETTPLLRPVDAGSVFVFNSPDRAVFSSKLEFEFEPAHGVVEEEEEAPAFLAMATGGSVEFKYARVRAVGPGGALIEEVLYNPIGTWGELTDATFDGPLMAASSEVELDVSGLISQLTPSNYAWVSALALAGLMGLCRVRRHSLAVAS